MGILSNVFSALAPKSSSNSSSAAPLAISPTSGPVGTTFSVTPPAGASVKWTLNGSVISGATASSYTSTAAGTLGCQVSLAGVAVSAVANVSPFIGGLGLAFAGAF